MTIAAINPVIADVMFMAKLNRLLLLNIAPGQIRRTRNLRVNVKCNAAQKHRHDKTRFGDIVCSAMKNLCHFYSLTQKLIFHRLLDFPANLSSICKINFLMLSTRIVKP